MRALAHYDATGATEEPTEGIGSHTYLISRGNRVVYPVGTTKIHQKVRPEYETGFYLHSHIYSTRNA